MKPLRLIPALFGVLAAGTLAVAFESPKPTPSPTPVVTATPAPTATATPVPTPIPELAVPDDKRPFTNAPTGGGLGVEGLDSSPMEPFSSYSISFPSEMVAPDRIDAEGSESPIEIWPTLDAEFTWHSQSEGSLFIKGPLIPNQTYRIRLRQGLKDLAGQPLPEDEWGFNASTAPLKITEEGYGERDRLNARPQVPLEFNFPIRLEDAAKGVWIQDRATRERLPVEVLLNYAEGEMKNSEVVDAKPDPEQKIYSIRVRPVDPLPVNRRFDLVVEDVHDAYSGRSLLYPRVFALGTTAPLKVDYVSARNYPLEKPSVEVKFIQLLSDDIVPPDALSITPPVPNLKVLRQGQYLTAEGDFDTSKKYSVTISDHVLGVGGFGLEKPETWGATFRPKEASIIFPSREIRERSTLGLNFSFYQVNTSELEWKLAEIPLDKLPEVLARENEFGEQVTDDDGNVTWTKEGLIQRASSEPLIPALGLNVVGSGKIDAASGEKETLREIAWKPQGTTLVGGPMLFEVTGKDAEGRVIGNRSVIYFGDSAITRKVADGTDTLRVANLGDAKPVAGATISALDEKMREVSKLTTAQDGIATISDLEINRSRYLLVETGSSKTLQPIALMDRFASGSSSITPPSPLRGYTMTDRPLYRPGQEVQFKGFVRNTASGALTIPKSLPIKWTIQKRYSSEVLANGEAKLDANGSWNGSWEPPENAPLGEFSVKSTYDGVQPGAPGEFQIEEFRNPPFSVVCEDIDDEKPAESVITVESQYFHGAANAGAKVAWTATWTSDSDGEYYSPEEGDDMTRVDLYSEHARHPTYYMQASGETALDADGKATLRCEAPFKDPGNRANCYVNWKVDVTGPDGQTITGGTAGSVAMEKVLLGVRRETSEEKKGELIFSWNVKEFGGTAAPDAVQAEFFHVVTKTVKERLAPSVYRYRNFDQYIPVQKLDRVTESRLSFTPKEPGRYVLIVSPLAGQPGFPVSEQGYIEGDEESENPVQSDSAAQVFSVTGRYNANDKPWNVGETAALNVLSPTPGVAWVSVETDKILETFTVPLQGNTSRIEIPIKPEYEPNVYVSVYMLRPGGDTALAGEMFGYTELVVASPTRKLDLAVSTGKPGYEPREKITGEVSVKAAGQPVANADVLVYAVDDSILTLGNWQLPELIPSFIFNRQYGVVTYSALKSYIDKVEPSWLTMKGFVVGDGGDEPFNSVTFARKEFKPIILWKPNLTSNADGIVKYDCEAPDNLTRFRVIAVAQTKESQFGAADATFTVSKSLQIEPALPRFLRLGDEVELRTIVRQKVSESGKISVRCTVSDGVTLTSEPVQEVTAAKDAPVVVRFKAKAAALGKATIKFEASSVENPKLADAVEMPMPVAEPVILNKESVGGTVGSSTFPVREVAPGQWENTRGTFSLAISTTPWLNKLMGLPYLLEYPHGCFEQKSSRLLACTYLGGLLEYLPDPAARKASYSKVITDTLEEFEAGLLPGGMLPYWPSGTEPNVFVTIQAAWCVAQAEVAGFEVPERLASDLPETLHKIVTNKISTDSMPALRAFALFVLTQFEELDPDELTAASNELYLIRDRMPGDARAMLAIAMNKLAIEPEKQKQLISELPTDFGKIEFAPYTFSSATRTEALCTWARLLITPGQGDQVLRDRMSLLMESSSSLSTQENLWLLVAFNALLKNTPQVPIKAAGVTPSTKIVAPNGTAAAWNGEAIAKISDFVVKGLPKLKTVGSFVLSAAYRTDKTDTPAVTKGMKVERSIRNLTESKRDGSPSAPFKLGDQLLVSYRFHTDKPQSFVALEDMIPAGIEIVNPNLALFGQYYSLPPSGTPEANLSHSEMRDQQTNLYFDRLPTGSQGYSILARATAAGTFLWPATQISPMYDSRFFGRSASGVCVVAPE
jgi:uncharacterized protein YfaS (alpha-2-macroglobulin family)